MERLSVLRRLEQSYRPQGTTKDLFKEWCSREKNEIGQGFVVITHEKEDQFSSVTQHSLWSNSHTHTLLEKTIAFPESWRWKWGWRGKCQKQLEAPTKGSE